ncbi:unnamed protein product [Paramecium sonneborni]|uniref:Uncharacterized protein n=1 Tax=Paramecium sonneborni TaxID=65129 RepID=A0A8S1K6V1_9CILI|nr:unnamed protein product [Paramecium sonneborni]
MCSLNYIFEFSDIFDGFKTLLKINKQTSITCFSNYDLWHQRSLRILNELKNEECKPARTLAMINGLRMGLIFKRFI